VPGTAEQQLVERAVHLAGIAIERTRFARRIQEGEDRLAAVIDSAHEAIISARDDCLIDLFNPAAEKMFGCAAAEVRGQSLDRFLPREFLEGAGAGREQGATREVVCKRADGAAFPAEISIAVTRIGQEPLYTAVIRDITERQEAVATQQRLEGQLRRAQKLEAVGRLAGGIAHDFNNILGAIQGNTELMKMILGPGSAAHEFVDPILRSCQRASELVKQILLFSRQQEPRRQPCQLAALIGDELKLVRGTLPAAVELRCALSEEPTPVLVDAGQIHRVLFNLVANAVYAMRDQPGMLWIAVTPHELTGAGAERGVDLPPGHYARLSVADGGAGMDEATLARVFEPFFTTKPPGQGTGLGLSVIHGIVRDHEGAITVRSRVGVGTTVDIYFPLLAEAPVVATPARQMPPKGRGQNVLMVDDEPELLKMGGMALDRLGYQATLFNNSLEAWENFQAAPEKFHLLLTDLTMPGLDGVGLATRVRALRPDIPIVLITGYSAPAAKEAVQEAGINAVLLKPVSLDDLGETIHRLVDGGSDGDASTLELLSENLG
jgi:PAS domain S-box-containing protein